MFSVIVTSEARLRPNLEVYEIRENSHRRHNLNIKPIYGSANDRESELARILLPNRQNRIRKENRLVNYDTENYSDDYEFDGSDNIIFLKPSSLLEHQWLENKPDDDFVDKTRSVRLLSSRPKILYHL